MGGRRLPGAYNIFSGATRGWKKLSRNCCARDPMEARSRIPPYRAVGAAYAASPCYAASQAFLRKKTRGASSRTLLGRITKRRRKLQSSAQAPWCVATEAISGGWSRPDTGPDHQYLFTFKPLFGLISTFKLRQIL